MLSATTILILLLQLGFYYLGISRGLIQFESLTQITKAVALTLISLISFIEAVNLACGRFRWVRFALNTVLVFLVALLFIYHYEIHSSFDYASLIVNIRETVSKSFLETAWEEFHWYSISGLIGLAATILVGEYFWKLFSTPGRYSRPGITFGIYWTIYVGIFSAMAPTHDELIRVFQTAWNYHLRALDDVIIPETPRYPLVKTTENLYFEGRRNKELPNIFLVIMESFNANFVEAKTPDGREYTPFFNSLIPQGIYSEKFYGNSVQTIIGHASIMCSIIPTIRGMMAVDHPDLDMNCLPQVLGSKGYQTILYSDYNDPSFQNSKHFYKKAGYKDVEFAIGEFLGGLDPKLFWGWGLQDDVFFDRALANLDQKIAALPKNARGKPPLFVTLVTTNNHFWFKSIPDEQKYLYPNPSGISENFSNSIYLADKYLKEFFSELAKRPEFADSIVIITGDHSFPNGEHGVYANYSSIYEEIFKTPFLLLWPGHFRPERMSDVPHSQLDIAPTVLDLLGLKLRNHFAGDSIFDRSLPVNRSIYLVQPYSGSFLGVLKYPLKYFWNTGTRHEYLLNLQIDPKETKNYIGSSFHTKEIKELKAGIDVILKSDTLVKHNRIWGPE